MKGKVFITITILISLSMITSWGIPKKVIDQIQMITVMGYDYVDEELVRGTAIVPKYVSKSEVENIVYSNVDNLIYENQTNLNRAASEELYSGKMEIALYGSKLAKKGISPYIDYLTRNPSIGSRTHLAIVEDSAYTMMDQVKIDQSAGLYFSDLIEHNIINGNIPKTNLKIFHSNVKGKIKDPYLPVLKLKKDKAAIEGIGFFDEDKYVYKIPYKDAFYFNILSEDIGNGKYVLKKDNMKTAIQNIDSKRKFKIEGSSENPSITVKITLQGAIREYTGPNFKKHKNEINEMWKKDVETKVLELINKFQELGIDPISIGLQVKAKKRGFELTKWNEIYPDVDINLNVDSKLVESGTRD